MAACRKPGPVTNHLLGEFQLSRPFDRGSVLEVAGGRKDIWNFDAMVSAHLEAVMSNHRLRRFWILEFIRVNGGLRCQQARGAANRAGEEGVGENSSPGLDRRRVGAQRILLHHPLGVLVETTPNRR